MYILLELLLFGKPFNNIDLTRNILYTEKYHILNINITFYFQGSPVESITK